MNAKVELLHIEHKVIPQPYIVINGVDISNTTSWYVISGNHTYQVATPSQAVDLCFQFVKVFQKQFSHVCSHVWQLIEREIYKFEIPSLYGAVAHVVNQLNQNQ